MSEIISRVNTPILASPVMFFAQNSVRDNVPHRRVRTVEDVLFHAESHLSWFVLAVLHVFELGEGLFDGLVAIFRFESCSVVRSSSLSVDLLRCTPKSQNQSSMKDRLESEDIPVSFEV